MFGKILILVALGVVAVIMLSGIVVMAIGGQTAARWSNVLMRYRILAQVGALILVALVVYFANNS